MTDTPLITGAGHVSQVAGEYAARLARVLERISAYDCPNGRRYATDEYHDTARGLRNAAAWLAGDHDRTWAGQFGTIEAFRTHYADDALRGALHHLVWAEHFAGITDRETARAADPWR